jgi:CRP-like cAMP-binding protein
MVKTVLPEIPVFDSLNRHQIDELSSWLQRREYVPGQSIFNECDVPDGLYVLAKGTVEVVKQTAGCPLIVAQLEAPSVFGEMGLLNGEEGRSAAVRAKTAVVAGFLPGNLFAAKLHDNNIAALHIAVTLGRIACQRLRATTRKLATISEDFARHVFNAESSGVEGKKPAV